MVMTETLKRRFVKDTNLPIRVFDEPYFTHYMELYEQHMGAKTLYEMFQKELEKYSNEQEYLQEYNRVKDAAITYLAENPAMQYFCQQEDMQQYAVKNTGLPSNTVFKETMVGRYLLSIDMKKANFSALRHYNPAIVGNKDSYEEFLGMFTDSEYMKQSKYIRQVIFGNQNPKRQVRYEQYLMDLILSKIYEVTPLTKDNVVYFSADEIVLDVTDFELSLNPMSNKFTLIDDVNKVLCWASENNIRVRAEYYRLYRIRGTSGYMKDFVFPSVEKDWEIKSADSIEMPYIIRYLKNQAPEDMDGVFCMDGKLARLINPIVPELSVDRLC